MMVGQQHTFGATPSAFGGFGTISSTGFGRFGTNTSSAAFGISSFGQSKFGTPSTRSDGGLFGSFAPSGSTTASTFDSGVSKTLETSSFGQPFETLHPPASGTSFGTENISKPSFFGHSIPAGGLCGSSQSTGFGVSDSSNTQASTWSGGFGSRTSDSGIGSQSHTKPSFGFDASSTSSSAGSFVTKIAGGTKLFSNTFEYQTPPSGRFRFGVPSTASGNAATVDVTRSVDAQEKLVSDEKTAVVKFVPFEAGLDTMTRGGFTATVSTKICVITAMKEYEDMSMEELRLKDYLSGVKNSTSKQKQPHGFKFGSTKSDFPKTPGNLIWKPYGKSVGGQFGTNISWSNTKQNSKTEYNKYLFSPNTTYRNPWETQNSGIFDSKIQEFKFKPLFGTTTPPWSPFGKQNAKNDNKRATTSWGQFGKPNKEVFGTTGNKSIFGTNNVPWNSFANEKGCFGDYEACSKSYGSSAKPKSNNVIVGPGTKPWNSYGNQNKSFFIKPQDRQFFGVSNMEVNFFEEDYLSTSVEVMNNATKKIAMMCNDLKEYMDSSANSLALEMMRKREERIKELEGTVKDLEVEKELLKNFTHPAQLYGGKAYMNARIVGCCSVTQGDMKDIQDSIIRLRRDVDAVKKILNKYENDELEKEMVVEDSRGFADVSMKNWGFRLPHQSTEENIQEFKNSIKQLEEEMKLLKISADELQEKTTKGDKRQKDPNGDKIMNCNVCSSVLETFNIAVKKDENIQENKNADINLETDLMVKKDFYKLCCEDNTFTEPCCEKPSSDQDRQKPYCRKCSDDQHKPCCKYHSSNEDHKEPCCKKHSFEDQKESCSKNSFHDNGQQKLCCEKCSLDKNPQTSCQKRPSPDRDQQKTCSKHCSPNRIQLKTNDNHSPDKDQQRPCTKDQSTDIDHQKSSSTQYSVDAKEQQPCCKKRPPDKDQQQLPCNKDHSTDKDQQKPFCRYHSLDAMEQQLRCEKHSFDKDQQNFGCSDDDKSVFACKHCDLHSNLDPDPLKASQDNSDSKESFLIPERGRLDEKWCDWYEDEDDWP